MQTHNAANKGVVERERVGTALRHMILSNGTWYYQTFIIFA